ncbi:hypothetical protein SVIOM342S_03762 [Streptomyces violaceorubidus]
MRRGLAPSMAMALYSSGKMSRMAPLRMSADIGRQNAAVGRMTPSRLSYSPASLIR